MKKQSTLLALGLFMVLALVTCTTRLLSQVPERMSYQGVITDASGTGLDGEHQITITLYESEDGGAPVYTETTTTEVVNGLFQRRDWHY